MGVTGLWTIVSPSARPIKLETLAHKRLAVDASIWIYQFLKAVRDKEGNALRNSHVVGFFRRICKLLHTGIKPVFVFDGGAPALKRRVITERKRRREGRREDARRTAARMMAAQMHRRAEEEEQREREERERGAAARQGVGEEEVPVELVYVDEIGMSAKERQQTRKFKKTDAYHLPNLDISLEELGAPNDPRVMSHEELEEYARQFQSGEDITQYDFSKIDYDSSFFLSLPASDRYNILNAARLRSRLRMGKTKEQLDGMFPDRMEFSRFQIERVRERNELTQRLMHINGMSEDFLSQGGRIAGEKGKEYILVKNDGVEGGWALGVVSNKSGQQDQPIDVDLDMSDIKESEDEEEDDDFEDIPIEGLNRLPKKWAGKKKNEVYNTDYEAAAREIAEKRKAIYEARAKSTDDHSMRATQPSKPPTADDDNALFVPEHKNTSYQEEGDDELFEDVEMNQAGSDDEDLERAIQMSLEKPVEDEPSGGGFVGDAFNQKNARLGREAAHQINARANAIGTNGVSQPLNTSEDEDNDLDLQAALAESRQTKYQPKGPVRAGRPQSPSARSSKPTAAQQQGQFSGPLPFESLNLGQSLLGKKKSQRIEEQMSGGFDKDESSETKKASQALPPWFKSKDKKETPPDRILYTFDEESDEMPPESTFSRQKIRRNETREIIDVDTEDEKSPSIIHVDSDVEDQYSKSDILEPQRDKSILSSSPERDRVIDAQPRMGDPADLARAEPPQSNLPPTNLKPTSDQPDDTQIGDKQVQALLITQDDDESIDWSESDDEHAHHQRVSTATTETADKRAEENSKATSLPSSQGRESESPDGRESNEQQVQGEDNDVDFEDVGAPPPALLRQETSMNAEQQAAANQYLIADDEDGQQPDNADPASASQAPKQPIQDDDDDEFMYESEDEELMAQMATEAEAHAEFTSTFNNRSTAENLAAYEEELKRLRNQQKKDRRDADEVTSTMATEVQALLGLFGLPYITAPMEAEAQCAELVKLGLVDGVVTDDSDIFLFGGTRVYKNFFNGKKFVECYLAADLEREFNLSRQKLVACAQVLGSDYCDGLSNIGPVGALEILAEFGNLTDFAEWYNGAYFQDPKIIKSDPSINSWRRKFHKRHATGGSKGLLLPNSFPSQAVEDAYLHPDVDSDPTGFQWGVPDLDQLRNFLMATIGWSRERTDEILVPVVRDMGKKEREGTQANLTRFFTGAVGAGVRGVRGEDGKERVGGVEVGAPRRVAPSGRMERALGRLKGVEERNQRARDGEAGDGRDGEVDGQDATRNGKGKRKRNANGASSVTNSKTKRKGRKAAKKSKRAYIGGKSDDDDDDGTISDKGYDVGEDED